MRLKNSKKFRDSKGFTLMELMIATLIISLVFIGIVLCFVRCMELSELARNSSNAVLASKSRLAEIENTAFNQIVNTYNNVTFTTPGLNGIGTTTVDGTNPDLLIVTVTFCWKQKNGRMIGEDADLNGQMLGSEDTDGDGIFDAPVKLVTAIYNS